MATIKIKQSVTEEKELHIDVPCFRKNENKIVKITEDSHTEAGVTFGVGRVTPYGSHIGVSEYFKEGWSEATEAEYTQMLIRVRETLNEFIEKEIQVAA